MMPGFALLVPTQGGEFYPPPLGGADGRPGRRQKKKNKLWNRKKKRKVDINNDSDVDVNFEVHATVDNIDISKLICY